MDGNGVWRFPEGSGRQGRVERYYCNVICGAPTTSEFKGLRWDDDIREHTYIHEHALTYVRTYLNEHAYIHTHTEVCKFKSSTQGDCSTFLSTFQRTVLVHGLTSNLLQWIKGRELINKTKRVVTRNKLSWYDKSILWCFNKLSHPFSQNGKSDIR